MNLESILKESYTYPNYLNHVNELLLQGKTTGNNQTEELVEFTKLNVQRMNRLDKTIHISDDISKQLQTKIARPLQWLLIGDAWCGDCAQIIPVLNKIALASSDTIKFNIILKDTYPELIETYSTNGAKSVPKLLILNKNTNEVLSTWGPRPKPAQNIMLNWKANIDTIKWEEFEKELHLWYARDKGQHIVEELTNLIFLL